MRPGAFYREAAQALGSNFAIKIGKMKGEQQKWRTCLAHMATAEEIR